MYIIFQKYPVLYASKVKKTYVLTLLRFPFIVNILTERIIVGKTWVKIWPDVFEFRMIVWPHVITMHLNDLDP
jgi:hypothetical protein